MIWNSIEEKAEALDFARPLDVHKWSDFPEVNAAVDALWLELKIDPEFGGNKRLKKKHIKVVVLDLYAAWLSHPDYYVSVFRDANRYGPGGRYNALHISFLTVAVVDVLERGAYVEVHPGYNDRLTGKSAISRIRATDKLISLIKIIIKFLKLRLVNTLILNASSLKPEKSPRWTTRIRLKRYGCGSSCDPITSCSIKRKSRSQTRMISMFWASTRKPTS